MVGMLLTSDVRNPLHAATPVARAAMSSSRKPVPVRHVSVLPVARWWSWVLPYPFGLGLSTGTVRPRTYAATRRSRRDGYPAAARPASELPRTRATVEDAGRG